MLKRTNDSVAVIQPLLESYNKKFKINNYLAQRVKKVDSILNDIEKKQSSKKRISNQDKVIYGL